MISTTEEFTPQSVDIYELIRDLTVGDNAVLRLGDISFSLTKITDTKVSYSLTEEEVVYDISLSCYGTMSFNFELDNPLVGYTTKEYDGDYKLDPEWIYNIFLCPENEQINLTIHTNIPSIKSAGKK